MRNKYVSTTPKKKQTLKKNDNTRKPIKMNEIYCKRHLGGGL